MEHLNPAAVEVTQRGLDTEAAEPVQRYVDSLSERQRRDLLIRSCPSDTRANSRARRGVPHEVVAS